MEPNIALSNQDLIAHTIIEEDVFEYIYKVHFSKWKSSILAQIKTLEDLAWYYGNKPSDFYFEALSKMGGLPS